MCIWRGSRAASGAAAAAALLAGCAVGPDFVRPAAPAVSGYRAGADPAVTVPAHGTAQRFLAGGEVEREWWRMFQSEALDRVMAQALADSPDLEAARAGLRRSEDELRAGYGVFYPQAQLAGQAARERRPGAAQGGGTALIFNLFTLGASVNYALDLFGGERRAVEGLEAETDVQRAAQQATYLTLEANVVNTLIARAAYRAEITATRELVRLTAEQVRLAQVRADAGTAAYSGVLILQTELAQFQAGIPQLEQKAAQADDLLAALVGHPPAEWSAPELALADLTLPPQLPVSVPSELLQQRPDILTAQAQLHATGAAVGVATAALLPSVTLGADYGAASNTTAGLSLAGSRSWDAGVNLQLPLFQGGTLWFHRQAALDAWRQAQAHYRQTVLDAFAQVADTLAALEHDAAVLAAEDDAVDSARSALHLAEIDYQSGLATYLDVLAADTLYQQALIADLSAQAARYQDTVALYVALGGGWSEDRPAQGASRDR